MLILPKREWVIHKILIIIWRILSYRAPLFQTVSPPQNEELGLHAIPWLGGRFKNPKRYIHHICMMWCCCCRVDVLQSFHQVQFRVYTLQKFRICAEINCLEKQFICHIIRKPKVALTDFFLVLTTYFYLIWPGIH